MKNISRKLIILFLLTIIVPKAFGQLTGVVTDSITNEPLMYISVFYEGKGVGGITDVNGVYKIETRRGWNKVTFSAIGYVTKVVTIPSGAKELNVKLSPADIQLKEVVIKPQKEKYSRKNNPAVDFMRKVIANKSALRIEENDYFKVDKYQKMKTSLNDITPEKLERAYTRSFRS